MAIAPARSTAHRSGARTPAGPPDRPGTSPLRVGGRHVGAPLLRGRETLSRTGLPHAATAPEDSSAPEQSAPAPGRS